MNISDLEQKTKKQLIELVHEVNLESLAKDTARASLESQISHNHREKEDLQTQIDSLHEKLVQISTTIDAGMAIIEPQVDFYATYNDSINSGLRRADLLPKTTLLCVKLLQVINER